MNHMTFADIQGGHAFEAVFDEEELRTLVDGAGLGALHGLRRFSIEAQDGRYVKTALRKHIFTKNASRLQEIA